MTQKHTPGTVYLHPENGRKLMAGDVHLATAQRIPASPVEAWANAKRLAACWNACAGVPTEEVEGVSVSALMAALAGLIDAVERDSAEKGISGYTGARLSDARAALARADPA
jgi:hypothetical protein